jgi:hypothetical protein
MVRSQTLSTKSNAKKKIKLSRIAENVIGSTIGIETIPWPRCKVCDGAIYKGFNEDRVRNVATDDDGKLYHIFAIDCMLSPRVFNKEEPDIVY